MNKLGYLLIPLVALLLVVAQALWGSFIKTTRPFHGSTWEIISRFFFSPMFWTGALLYIFATLMYFLALSKFRFFIIQISVTALAILCSTTLSWIMFHERVTVLNLMGMLIVIAGLGLVMIR